MKDFKFLTAKKPVFRFEITSNIKWSPACYINYESWSLDKSNLIKRWLSDICFREQTTGWEHTKYFPEFDRTCEIVQLGIDTHNHHRVFTAIIKVYRSVNEYMEVDLTYSIDDPIYE